MKNILERPPRTIMEVFKSLPEGTLAELIDNILYMSPSPVSKHQIALNEINFQLLQYFKKHSSGSVFISRLDVFLDEENNAVQPDIIVIMNENRHIIHENGYIHGVPDLLIEVLSPGNKEHDLIIKKDLYERFGVKEYWIVDPDTKLSLGYVLEGTKYKQTGENIGFLDISLLKITIKFQVLVPSAFI